MPRPIRFCHDGAQLSFQMHKLDRDRLYGAREWVVRDADDQPCELATLADDGRTLIGRGGTGIGQLTADGKWTDKSRLTPVDLEGRAIEPVPSSFAAPIELNETTEFDDYLNHNVRLIYELRIDASPDTEEGLLTALRAGTIFKFPYSYRGGLEPDVGFLLANSQDRIFLLIGNPTRVQFIGLQTTTAAPDPAGVDDDDLLDFSLM